MCCKHSPLETCHTTSPVCPTHSPSPPVNFPLDTHQSLHLLRLLPPLLLSLLLSLSFPPNPISLSRIQPSFGLVASRHPSSSCTPSFHMTLSIFACCDHHRSSTAATTVRVSSCRNLINIVPHPAQRSHSHEQLQLVPDSVAYTHLLTHSHSFLTQTHNCDHVRQGEHRRRH